MKSWHVLLLVLLLTLSACSAIGPSDNMIQTAIAETQTSVARQRSPGPTATVSPTRVRVVTPTTDLEATRRASSSAAVVLATAHARTVFDHVMRLVSEGQLADESGNAFVLSDFSNSWAQLGWYQWTYSGRALSEFVIRTDVSWSSASERANWYESGCGYVFGEQDSDNHFLAYLALDGWVRLAEIRKGRWIDLGSAYAGSVDTPDGGANLMLLVVDKKISIFVDDKLIKTRQINDDVAGNLAFTVLSGTNKDFGTRCEMKNVKLWEIGHTALPLADDFSDPGSGWRVGDMQNGGWAGYEGGVYSLRSPGDWKAIVGVANQNLVNVEFEVEGMPILDAPAQHYTYGVVCRLQPNRDGYFMGINDDATAYIVKWVGDEHKYIAESRSSLVVHLGMSTNKFKAVCDGNYLALYVNDRLLVEGFDDTFAYGDVGVHGSLEADREFELHFDNATIREIAH